MNLLNRLRNRRQGSPAAAHTAADAPAFGPVTRLEKRLCLGGLAAAGVADLSPVEADGPAVNDATLLVAASSAAPVEAPPAEPQSESQSDSSPNVQQPAAVSSAAQAAAPDQGMTLIGEQLLRVLPSSAFVAASAPVANSTEGADQDVAPLAISPKASDAASAGSSDVTPTTSQGAASQGQLAAASALSATASTTSPTAGSAQSTAGGSVGQQALSPTAAQLTAADVELLLSRASKATASEDAIIAVVDRNGRILGVRVEADVLAKIPDSDTLVFAIDGAVAKARTAAMFSNGEAGDTLAPLTSRTVRFLSQSTVTQREVESNPNDDGTSEATAAVSTTRGPGFVAPVGVGGHFPPEVTNTPPVDLFAIEHTNRDSNLHPGADGVRGTDDDIDLRTSGTDADGETLGRFNIDPAMVTAAQELYAPESYGHAENSNLLSDAQSRGIATLPGGIPLFRDADLDGLGDTLVGGIGVFFPDENGYATYEQNFIPGIGQTEAERTNAPKVLEAEFIALAAAGGSQGAEEWIPGAKVGDIGGMPPVAGLDLPFGRLDLVGITLEVIGPGSSKTGIRAVLDQGAKSGAGAGADSGADQPLVNAADGFHRSGKIVPDQWLVNAHTSPTAGAEVLTAADVDQIISTAILAANETRAAVRLPLSSTTRMVFAITDTQGEVLGLYRMENATTFSLDVAVAKARNVAYYADAADLQPEDQVVSAGTAFTNRTFRFLAEPRYPSGIDGGPPPEFSILNDGNINQNTAENIGAPDPVSAFDSVLGFDAFTPMTNFQDPGDDGSVVAAGGGDPDTANQNGIVFFPGSTPLYKNGVLVGGFGVSGDGVDQDDVVTFLGAQGFLPPDSVTRADEVVLNNVRLPYQKFLRNPFGL